MISVSYVGGGVMASRWTLLNHIAVGFTSRDAQRSQFVISKSAFGWCLCILMYSWRESRVIPLLLRRLYRSAREPSVVRRTHESEAAGAEGKTERAESFYGNGVLTHAQHALWTTVESSTKKSSARAHSCLLVPQTTPLLIQLGWGFCVCVCVKFSAVYIREIISGVKWFFF